MLTTICRYANRHGNRFHSFAGHMFDEIPERSALNLFDSLPERNPCFYNSTVIGLAKHGNVEESLKLFCRANSLGIRHTKYALCSALNSCMKALNQRLGLQIHARIIRIGYEENLFLNSALVDLYAKCDALVDAKRVFDGMEEHDQVSWTSIISGFAQDGFGKEALEFFKKMLKSEIRPNCFTFTSVISACTGLESAFEQVALLHAHVIKLGFEPNNYVISSLVDCYAKCGKIREAMLVFDAAVERDVIVYNAMIAGFSQNLLGEEALKLFIEMRQSETSPTHFTFSSLLNACGSLAVLRLGKQIHLIITKMGLDRNVFITCSLVDMYSKCGSVDDARCIFDSTVERNSILWTSMIMGFAQNGRVEDGLELFELLVKDGVKPDHVCFTGVLTACNHAGFLDKGIGYFDSMRSEYGLVPDLDQYACIIDLYGRNGHLRKAKELMDCMPFEPNSVMWSSFLGSCRVHGEIELGVEAANHLLKMEPFNATSYVTLANMYADVGMWDEVAEVRKMMKCKGLRKRAGCSWIEVDKRVHVFSVCDSSHPQWREIYSELDKLIMEMRQSEYLPTAKRDVSIGNEEFDLCCSDG
ncbi:pentatricopeptide repeat-containing protein At2g13600-like [Magnolia sinica]|uniref:pentatricopeptide repeat-containing protein At2g13600-like n=1 Tax=Magnolia sinica TaxID=86752 RepID=UPI002659991B|nr:pentatricopeptide repeat-containing protein At2g13600-like [Magnolia sinica]